MTLRLSGSMAKTNWSGFSADSFSRSLMIRWSLLTSTWIFSGAASWAFLGRVFDASILASDGDVASTAGSKTVSFFTFGAGVDGLLVFLETDFFGITDFLDLAFSELLSVGFL